MSLNRLRKIIESVQEGRSLVNENETTEKNIKAFIEGSIEDLENMLRVQRDKVSIEVIRRTREVIADLKKALQLMAHVCEDYIDEDGEGASFDGGIGDLGELPKVAYGSVDSRGGSMRYKDKSMIKKKKRKKKQD